MDDFDDVPDDFDNVPDFADRAPDKTDLNPDAPVQAPRKIEQAAVDFADRITAGEFGEVPEPNVNAVDRVLNRMPLGRMRESFEKDTGETWSDPDFRRTVFERVRRNAYQKADKEATGFGEALAENLGEFASIAGVLPTIEQRGRRAWGKVMEGTGTSEDVRTAVLSERAAQAAQERSTLGEIAHGAGHLPKTLIEWTAFGGMTGATALGGGGRFAQEIASGAPLAEASKALGAEALSNLVFGIAGGPPGRAAGSALREIPKMAGAAELAAESSRAFGFQQEGGLLTDLAKNDPDAWRKLLVRQAPIGVMEGFTRGVRALTGRPAPVGTPADPATGKVELPAAPTEPLVQTPAGMMSKSLAERFYPDQTGIAPDKPAADSRPVPTAGGQPEPAVEPPAAAPEAPRAKADRLAAEYSDAIRKLDHAKRTEALERQYESQGLRNDASKATKERRRLSREAKRLSRELEAAGNEAAALETDRPGETLRDDGQAPPAGPEQGGIELSRPEPVGEGMFRHPIVESGRDIGGVTVTLDPSGRTIDLLVSADKPLSIGQWKGMLKSAAASYPEAETARFQRTTGARAGEWQEVPLRRGAQPASESVSEDAVSRSGAQPESGLDVRSLFPEAFAGESGESGESKPAQAETRPAPARPAEPPKPDAQARAETALGGAEAMEELRLQQARVRGEGTDPKQVERAVNNSRATSAEQWRQWAEDRNLPFSKAALRLGDTLANRAGQLKESAKGSPADRKAEADAQAGIDARRQQTLGLTPEAETATASKTVRALMADDAGFINVGRAAAAVRNGLQAIADNLNQFGSRTFPTTKRLDPAVANKMASQANARTFAAEATPYYTERVTPGADQSARVRMGAAMTELRLRNIRDVYNRQMQQIAGQVAQARAQLQGMTDPVQIDRQRRLIRRMERAGKEAEADRDGVKDIFQMPGTPFADPRALQQYLGTQEFADFTKNWQQWMVPQVDRFYRASTGITQGPLPPTTQIPGMPINLARADVTPPAGGGQGNIRNVKVKPTVFTRQAKGNADAYAFDVADIIRNTFERSARDAAHAETVRTMIENGHAVLAAPGTVADVAGEKAVAFPFTNPKSGTQPGAKGFGEKVLYVRESMADDYRNVLEVDKPSGGGKLAKALTGTLTAASIASLQEPTAHGGNILTALMYPRAIAGTLKTLPDAIRGTPEYKATLVELARIGAQKGKHAGETPFGFTGRALHSLNNLMRVAMNHAYDSMVKSGDIVDTEHGRRDFINAALGQYNRAAQHRIVRWARSTGLGSFATAGVTMTSNAVRTGVGLSPNVTATSNARALKLRGEILAKIVAGFGAAAAANYAKWGRPDGDESTPFGAVKLAENSRGGPVIWQNPFVWMTDRGLRSLGLNALSDGLRLGRPAGHTADKALEQSFHAVTHPFVGPPLQFAHTLATGENALGVPIADRAKKGESQTVQNLEAALMNVNPTIGSLFGANTYRGREAPWSERVMNMFGKLGPQSRAKKKK